jgi:hypothetical protein
VCSVVFQNNTDPFIQARALAVNSGVPGAIFRFASEQPDGPQSTFDLPNGFLDLTSRIYVSVFWRLISLYLWLMSVIVDSTSGVVSYCDLLRQSKLDS